MTAREYLIDRFRGDGRGLHERAALLAKGTRLPGPDLATSRRMADACEDVAAMIEAVATPADPLAAVEALAALVPLLEQRASAQTAPAVRSVYAGAATRIREIRQSEADAAAAAQATHDDAHGESNAALALAADSLPDETIPAIDAEDADEYEEDLDEDDDDLPDGSGDDRA